jgi:hypothetical protein
MSQRPVENALVLLLLPHGFCVMLCTSQCMKRLMPSLQDFIEAMAGKEAVMDIVALKGKKRW